MSKIAINKNFAKYFYKFVDNVFKPLTAQTTVSTYSGVTPTVTAISAMREVVVTKQSTLATLDKISLFYKTNATVTDWTNDLGVIINKILTESTRATTLTALVTANVITQAEKDAMLLINLTDRPVVTSTLTNDVIKFTMTNPNKLVRRYIKATDNTNNETLYVLFPYYSNNNFNGVLHYGSTFYQYPTTASEASKQALSYIAVSMGTTGTEDIVLDYADNIDYLDDMDIKIKIPTIINI